MELSQRKIIHWDTVNVNKHGKIEVTAFILLEHNGIKVQTNSKRNDREHPIS